jgi:hypothetical protein
VLPTELRADCHPEPFGRWRSLDGRLREGSALVIGARRIAMCLSALALVVATLSPARAAHAQRIPILLEGVGDGEFWTTTGNSNLLTRNGGRGSGLGRISLWGAVEPLPGFVLFGAGHGEMGAARPDTNQSETYMEQFGARYVFGRALVLDGGKLQPVVGTFTPRHFSNRNPLIGSPDGYSLEYPYGIKVSGEVGWFDYRAAMLTLPPTHENYTPLPKSRLRPAVGGGISPMPGLRLGASFTVGPYLNTSYSAAQLHNQPWTDFQQRVVAFDLAYARGYLETHAEAARGSYDVPGRTTSIVGWTYYGEAKYTLSPRWFVAARVERNDYPFIRVFGTNVNWTARLTDFVDGEAGVGYRLSRNTLLKSSIRADRWWVAPTATGFKGQGGPAFAMQVSQAFDVVSWFSPAK